MGEGTEEVGDNLRRDIAEIARRTTEMSQHCRTVARVNEDLARILREIIFRELGKPNEKKKDKEDF